jgi:hypothetical protein
MLFDAGLTAWATLILAVLVLGAAVYVRRAWQAQAAQVRMLTEQLASDKALVREQLPVLEGQRHELEASRRLREREELERREAHVSRVYIWQEFRTGDAAGPPGTGARPGRESRITARNVGAVPVYEAAFAWSAGGDLARFDKLETPLLPGPQGETRSWPLPPDVAPEEVTVAVFIRDANWNRWRIQADGRRQPFTGDMLPPGTW